MIETDGDEFDCQDCPIMDALEQVWPENREAWALFNRVCTRFTREFQVVPVLLQKVMADRDADDAVELAERITVIYDTLYPPKPQKQT